MLFLRVIAFGLLAFLFLLPSVHHIPFKIVLTKYWSFLRNYPYQNENLAAINKNIKFNLDFFFATVAAVIANRV